MTRHLLNLRFLHRRDQRDFVGTRENRTGLRPSSSYKCVLVIRVLTISNLYSCSVNNIMFWNLQRILWEDADPAWDQVDLPFVESDGLVWPIFAAFSTAQHQCTAVLAWANFSSMYYLLRQREIHSLGKEKSSAKVNPLHFHVLGSWASLLLPHGSLLHARVTEENLNLPLGFFRTSGICRNSVSSFGENTQQILNSVVSCCYKR